MKKITLLFLFFITHLVFCQGSVKYDSKTKSIDVASGVEGEASIRVKFYGSAESAPIVLETMSCGNTEGLQIFSYSKGSIMDYYQNETNIVFKFKRTVSSDTRVTYKFSTNGSCFQDEADMIKITVNYKAQVINPPTSKFDNLITIFHNYRNTIISDLNIDEGSIAPEISGIFIPSSQYDYEYVWEKKSSNGIWALMPGEGSYSIYPGYLSETTTYRRAVKKKGSADNIPISNEVTLTVIPAPPAKEITNNVITLYKDNVMLGGYRILGSTPVGGIGYFRYEYYAYNEFEGEVIGEVQMVGADIDYYQRSIGGLPLKFYRKVYSKDKVSFSNTVTIFPVASSARMATISNIETASSDLTVYPNPTTEVVNFATNFSTNKEIEIVVYSETIRNEKSVFRGTVTPNQVVSWNIPSGYAKGIYFYKILSGSKEVKTGKIIVQ
ncbi:hypothetical protein CFS9_08540 [Flavobacterium sp. CFS9]|uniref:Por secretion system C-terminal sorting domain-containing protein n=1 Tax=Flavobacterium sp. CFS9 TaxID=3143118 RepID=A0AAT9GYD5_9FLAO